MTDVNIPAFDKTIALLELISDEHFNMGDWQYCPGWYSDKPSVGEFLHTCGSVACIGGFAEIAIFKTVDKMPWPEVGAALGLSVGEADQLFFMSGQTAYGFSNVTRLDAIQHLKSIRAGNAIDWSFIGEKEQ